MVCFPEHPFWSLLLGIWNDAFHATGGNDCVGRSRAHRLHCLGTENVEMKVHVEVAQIGKYRRTHLLPLRAVWSSHPGEWQSTNCGTIRRPCRPILQIFEPRRPPPARASCKAAFALS